MTAITGTYARSSAKPEEIIVYTNDGKSTTYAGVSNIQETTNKGITFTYEGKPIAIDLPDEAKLVDVSAILAMLADMLNEIKKASRQVAQASAQATAADLNNQADEIKDGACDTFLGDIINNTITAAFGAVALGAGFKSYQFAHKVTSSSKNMAQEMKNAETLQAQIDGIPARKAKLGPSTDHTYLDVELAVAKRKLGDSNAKIEEMRTAQKTANDKSQGLATSTQAITLTGQAVGGIVSAKFHYDASAHQAAQTESESAQQLHSYSADEAKQIMQTIGELFEKLIQTISEIDRGETDTIKAIWQA